MDSSRSLIWIGAFIGGSIGGFIPSLWGADMFSVSSLLLSGAGAIGGIWIAFKLTH